MFRATVKQLAIIALMAGLVFRALAPLGYMPGSEGSGFLFELCPDQLPAGVMLPGASASEHHHHHGVDDDSAPAASDQCDLGHFLFSAIAGGHELVDIALIPGRTVSAAFIPSVAPQSVASLYRPRGPPAL